MSDQERIEQFLTLFKELESEVLKINGDTADEYVNFSRALNNVYHLKKNEILADYENYSFFKTCAEVRNLLSHQNDVCVPTQGLINQLSFLLKEIVSPLSIYEVCTKNVVFTTSEQTVREAMERMEKQGLSHLPILDKDHRVKGVFSRSSIFDYLLKHDSFSLSMKIQELGEVTKLGQHQNEAFLLSSKNAKISTLYTVLSKREKTEKKAVLVLVTEHGRIEEELLGVATISDLLLHYQKIA